MKFPVSKQFCITRPCHIDNSEEAQIEDGLAHLLKFHFRNITAERTWALTSYKPASKI